MSSSCTAEPNSAGRSGCSVFVAVHRASANTAITKSPRTIQIKMLTSNPTFFSCVLRWPSGARWSLVARMIEYL